MWLIVGLGNPGAKYLRTPHNLGFDCVDLLAQRLDARWQEQSKFQSYAAGGSLAGERVFLLKPVTYMNLSGNAVQPFADYYKIELPRIVVVCDDVALPYGRIRLRQRGSHGGHNGLRDLVNRFASEDFARLRIGCQPNHPVRDLAGYVLGPMTGEAWDLSRLSIEVAADCVETILTEGFGRAMSRYNAWNADAAEE